MQRLVLDDVAHARKKLWSSNTSEIIHAAFAPATADTAASASKVRLQTSLMCEVRTTSRGLCVTGHSTSGSRRAVPRMNQSEGGAPAAFRLACVWLAANTIQRPAIPNGGGGLLHGCSTSATSGSDAKDNPLFAKGDCINELPPTNCCSDMCCRSACNAYNTPAEGSPANLLTIVRAARSFDH